MRISKPDEVDKPIPYTILKVLGCSDQAVGFTLISQQGEVGKRRYCNKVLVHECATVDIPEGMDLDGVEFLATSDPTYQFFEFYKVSEGTADIDPTVELERNDDGAVTHIDVYFAAAETSGMPTTMAYRLYGLLSPTGERVLLANGRLFIPPCGPTNCTQDLWTEVMW